ncbi:MAG: universal stress protein [Acidimicrobiales bacterium]
MFESVVVGATESAAAGAALRRAIEVAQASGGTLHIVTAFRPKRPAPPRLPEELRYACGPVDPVDVFLHDLKTRAARECVQVDIHPVLAGPVEAITRVAVAERADLIVVGSRSRRGPRHRGRVARAVMAQAHCAVLVV